MAGASPHRQGFRVEHRIRALTAEEEELVRARRASWRAEAEKIALKGTQDANVAAVVAAIATAFGALRGIMGLAVGAGAATLFMLAMGVVARRNARARARMSRGPWDRVPGEDTDRVREIDVYARSCVGAVSGDEDYMYWLLFEVPGGTWFYLDPLSLPEGKKDVHREELHFVELFPHGPWLHVDARGDTIPHHGATSDSEAYADAVDRGFVWSPPDDADGLVPEEKLPEWIRARR